MITDCDSVPVIGQRVKGEDFSKDNGELFLKIVELSHLKDSMGLVLAISKSKIDGWSIGELSKLQSKGNEFSLVIAIHENALAVEDKGTVEKGSNAPFALVRRDTHSAYDHRHTVPRREFDQSLARGLGGHEAIGKG